MASRQERSIDVGSGPVPDEAGLRRTLPDHSSVASGDRPLGPLEVTLRRLEPVTVDTALSGLLRDHPGAVVLALDEGALRVPLPDDDRFASCRELPAPGKTVMDFVEAPDRILVVTCWERAHAVGLAQARVRLSQSAAPHHILTIIDARERHGVFIELLVPQVDVAATAHSSPQVQLPSPRRPRTAIVYKNLTATIVAIDERASALLGWSAEEMVGHRSLEFVHPDDQERAIGQWLEMRSSRASQRVRVRHRRSDDTWLWVEIENEYLGVGDPENVVAVARLTDVSEEMAAVEALRHQEALFRRLTESLPVGVVQIDRTRHVVYTNARAGRMLGAAPTVPWPELVDHLEAPSRARLEQAISDALTGGPDDQLEATVVVPGEPQRRQHLFTVVGLPGLEEEGASGVLMSFTDVTDSVRVREHFRLQATRDPLTGCLNRSAVMAALSAALGGPDAAGVAVIFLDLDGFKTINDTAGHAVGDEVLNHIGRRLTAFSGRDRTVGRLGGDEFLLLCTEVADEGAAVHIAEQLRDHLSAPLLLPAGRFLVHASLGVAVARPGTSPEALVALADQAMYRAKETGGDRVHRHGRGDALRV